MKGKIVMLSAASVLTLGAALHVGHQPPADGICPLGKIIHGKQSRVAESNKRRLSLMPQLKNLLLKNDERSYSKE